MMTSTWRNKTPLQTTIGLGVVLGSGLSALLLAVALNATSVLALSGVALLYPTGLAMLGGAVLVMLAMPALSGVGALTDHAHANAPGADQIVNATLMHALQRQVDTVYLNPDDRSLNISFETGGLLQEATPAPRTLQAEIVARLKRMADLDVAQTEHPQQGQLRIKSQGRQVSILVATTPSSFGERLALHLSAPT